MAVRRNRSHLGPPRLLDALSSIQCEIAAINPALREAYHSGASFFFFVDTSCQTGADSISPSVRPSVRQSERRLSQEKLVKITVACDAQRPVPTCTRPQGQSAVPCKTPHARRCGRARVRACVLYQHKGTPRHIPVQFHSPETNTGMIIQTPRFGQDHSK